MKKVPLVITVIGLIFLAIGIVIVFANPLQTHGYYGPIHTYGRIVYLDEESQPTESFSETYVDAKGCISIIVGVGLLSVTLLDRIVKKKHK